jgi:hypothetical protein
MLTFGPALNAVELSLPPLVLICGPGWGKLAMRANVQSALKSGEIINVPDLSSEMTESLADLIVYGAPPKRGRVRQGPRHT